MTFLPDVDELGDRRAAGSFLQAYDKATGKLLHSTKIEKTLHSSPMSYLHEGRQYLLIASGGRGDEKAELLAFALPVGGG